MVEAPILDESTTRSIALADDDWLWATWRPRKPRQIPAEIPFDRDAVLERIATKTKPKRWGREFDFSRAGLSPAMSKDEARVWFECMHGVDKSVTPKARAESLKKKKLAPLTIDAAMKIVKEDPNARSPHVPLVLAALFGAMKTTEAFLANNPTSDGWIAGGSFFDGWHTHVLPLLTEDERTSLLDRVRTAVTPAKYPSSDYYAEPAAEFLVAASLGAHDELRAVVESIPDGHYGGEDWHDAYHVPQIMIFGLGSAELVQKHMRRLNLALRFEVYVRAWLAHTEYGGLDWVAKTICETTNKDKASELAKILALVHAPENAGPMLEVQTRSKAAIVGVEWLNRNVGCAAAGLVAIAAGRGALAESATERLRALKRAGYTQLIENAAGSAAPEAADKAKALLASKEKVLAPMTSTPKWLADAAKKVSGKNAKPAKLPAWLDPTELPALDIEGKTLSPEHLASLLAALAASIDAPHALVTAIRARATEASRDAFVRKLFESWLGAGAPSKDKWAFVAMGHLGGDASALDLAPLVRAWPGESQHARAVIGLDVLKNIGTDVALMQLSGIAAKVKFQALKARAGEAMEAIAKSRKMTRDELEDRIVPDAGFDASGKRVLDFGARKFFVVLGAEGAPMVRDEAGARKADLPKPGAKDDAKLAERSIAEWKLLKKTLREVTKIQVVRLEQAMVKGRTWSAKDFVALVVKHPLMGHLARAVVFGVKKGSKIAQTFRVAEDGTLADEKDAKYTLPKDALVVIAHPLDLTDAQKAAWGQVFGDYELLAPFEQLGRPTFALDAKEKKKDDLAPRFSGKEWGVSAFVGRLARRGWVHGHPEDAGYVHDHAKPFYSANVTAVVEHTGYPIGAREYADPQEIDRVFFVKGTTVPPPWGASKKRIKLEKVDRKALSEVLYDLNALG